MATALATDAADGAEAADAAAAAEQQVIERSNGFRRQQGLQPVQAQPALTAAARELARFMARTGRYAHDADGRQPVQRTQAAGYAHCLVAENIAWQFHSEGFEPAALAQAFVQGWIDSPPHRRNLLTADATDTGVAVARSASSGRYYAVQVFGRPASMRLRFELGNRSRQDLRYRVDGQPYPLPAGMTRWHESCAAPAVAIELPGRAEPLTLQPGAGARIRIDAARDGALRVTGGG